MDSAEAALWRVTYMQENAKTTSLAAPAPDAVKPNPAAAAVEIDDLVQDLYQTHATTFVRAANLLLRDQQSRAPTQPPTHQPPPHPTNTPHAPPPHHHNHTTNQPPPKPHKNPGWRVI